MKKQTSMCRPVTTETQDFLRVVTTQPPSPLQDRLSLLVCCTSYATIECCLLQIALRPNTGSAGLQKLSESGVSSRDLSLLSISH